MSSVVFEDTASAGSQWQARWPARSRRTAASSGGRLLQRTGYALNRESILHYGQREAQARVMPVLAVPLPLYTLSLSRS